MPDDVGFDVRDIIEAVDRAEVLVIRFEFTSLRLLIDLRPNGDDPPVLMLAPQASAIEERFRSVREARPQLPVPDRILSFQWPRHAALMESAGVWPHIVSRLRESGPPSIQARSDEIWSRLLAAERRTAVEAVRGSEAFRTIWARPSTD